MNDGKLVHMPITGANPIKIGTGLVSKPYYVMTGPTIEDSMNNPAMSDIEISSLPDIPAFKLLRPNTMAHFTVSAGTTVLGEVRFIKWKVESTDKKYSNIPDTKVVVYNVADFEEYKG